LAFFRLTDKVAQRRLADHREQRLQHGVIRAIQRRLGEREQHAVLVSDAAQIIEQFAFDPAFGTVRSFCGSGRSADRPARQ